MPMMRPRRGVAFASAAAADGAFAGAAAAGAATAAGADFGPALGSIASSSGHSCGFEPCSSTSTSMSKSPEGPGCAPLAAEMSSSKRFCSSGPKSSRRTPMPGALPAFSAMSPAITATTVPVTGTDSPLGRVSLSSMRSPTLACWSVGTYMPCALTSPVNRRSKLGQDEHLASMLVW
jgi:hypothetical protein